MTGCVTSHYPDSSLKRSNFGGIVEVNRESYLKVSPNTLGISKNDLVNKPDVTGSQIKILWGLITLTDY